MTDQAELVFDVDVVTISGSDYLARISAKLDRIIELLESPVQQGGPWRPLMPTTQPRPMTTWSEPYGIGV